MLEADEPREAWAELYFSDTQMTRWILPLRTVTRPTMEPAYMTSEIRLLFLRRKNWWGRMEWKRPQRLQEIGIANPRTNSNVLRCLDQKHSTTRAPQTIFERTCKTTGEGVSHHVGLRPMNLISTERTFSTRYQVYVSLSFRSIASTDKGVVSEIAIFLNSDRSRSTADGGDLLLVWCF